MGFWMGVASADHAEAGRDGGFAQLGHGKHVAVKSLKRGDWIVYYSPRTALSGGDPVRAFTTIGCVTSDGPYQAEQAPGFYPFRVDVDYIADAERTPIAPLLEILDLTYGLGSKWGMAVRGPKAKLSLHDIKIIAEAMGVDPQAISAQAHLF